MNDRKSKNALFSAFIVSFFVFALASYPDFSTASARSNTAMKSVRNDILVFYIYFVRTKKSLDMEEKRTCVEIMPDHVKSLYGENYNHPNWNSLNFASCFPFSIEVNRRKFFYTGRFIVKTLLDEISCSEFLTELHFRGRHTKSNQKTCFMNEGFLSFIVDF